MRAGRGMSRVSRPAMSRQQLAVVGRLVPSSRYRHPGDVIRLIAGSILLLVSLVASKAAHRWLLGPDAPVGGITFGPASDVLTGIVQVACVAAAALVVAAALWHRRYRLLLGLAAGAAVAAGVAAGILLLLHDRHPATLTDNLAHGSDSPESAAREIALWFS